MFVLIDLLSLHLFALTIDLPLLFWQTRRIPSIDAECIFLLCHFAIKKVKIDEFINDEFGFNQIAVKVRITNSGCKKKNLNTTRT